MPATSPLVRQLGMLSRRWWVTMGLTQLCKIKLSGWAETRYSLQGLPPSLWRGSHIAALEFNDEVGRLCLTLLYEVPRLAFSRFEWRSRRQRRHVHHRTLTERRERPTLLPTRHFHFGEKTTCVCWRDNLRRAAKIRLSDGRFHFRSRMSTSGSSSMSKATTNALRSCFSFASDSAPI